MLSQPASIQPAIIILIIITLAFTLGIIIALVRTFKPDVSEFWEKKYLKHSLTMPEINTLYYYIFKNTNYENKYYETTTKLYHVLKFLKKHLKTSEKIETFVYVAKKYEPETITAEQLIILINSQKIDKETLYRKIYNNYDYELIIKTVNIPEEWSDRMLFVKE